MYFIKEDTNNKKKYTQNTHKKRCPTWFVIREIQIKTIVRYCYIPVRMAKIKTLTTYTIDEDLEQLELLYSAGGNIKWYTTLENSQP